MVRVTYEPAPASWAEELARVEVGEVVAVEDGRAVIEFPRRNWGGDVTLLVSSLLAGEWTDSAALERCRLVGLEWPEGFPGPVFEAPERVVVGAIVKPPLGLVPREFAETAAALARRRAERAVELGATALMVNAFAQGLDALRVLREADLGVPLFAHRVGSAFWIRGPLGVAGTVVAELTRLCGADYVQVGSFSGRVFEDEEQVCAQVAACHRPIGGARTAAAVLGGGVGPENAAEHVRRAGAESRLLVLLGSRPYAHPGGVEEGVRAAVEAVRG